MKVLAAIIALFTLLGIISTYHMVGQPREPMTEAGGVVTILYGALIILLCMRVLGWA